MKRGIAFIAGLLLCLGLVSFASALCATPNQTIMTLSSSGTPGGAHGALWDQNYSTNLCYNILFDGYDASATNIHGDCNAGNTLFYLNANNNSHASLTNSAPYTIPVCYKGLKDCAPGGCGNKENCRAILYLSGETNAHISKSPFSTTAPKVISCSCVGECSIKETTVGPTGCYGYDEPSECNGDTELARGTGCNALDKNSCSCGWNATTGKCDVKWTASGGTWAAGFGVGECPYTCTVSGSEATECSGGSQIIRTLATTSPPACLAPAGACQAASATVSCGDIEASLPFFGYWQIASSLISIALVYALLGRKRLL